MDEGYKKDKMQKDGPQYNMKAGRDPEPGDLKLRFGLLYAGEKLSSRAVDGVFFFLVRGYKNGALSGTIAEKPIAG